MCARSVKWHCCWEKRVSDIVMEEVGECVKYWIGRWWQRRKDLLYGELMDGFWFPPSPPL